MRMYNFYGFVALNIFLSAVLTYLKQDILNYISITEEVIFTQIFLLFFFMIYYTIVENKNFDDFINKLIRNKYNSTYKLIIFDICLAIAIIISGHILIKEHIIYSKPIKIGGYLILISLISYFYKKSFSYHHIVGILLILLGIVFIEFGSRKTLPGQIC